MVGTGRFELPTPRTPSECSTRLSHVPTQGKTGPQLRTGFWGSFVSLHRLAPAPLHYAIALPAISIISSAIASDAVAAGLGAFSTCNAPSCRAK